MLKAVEKMQKNVRKALREKSVMHIRDWSLFMCRVGVKMGLGSRINKRANKCHPDKGGGSSMFYS